MQSIQSLVRPNILALEAYSSARDEYNGGEAVFLDANESPFGSYNRYPDPKQSALKACWANEAGLDTDQIFIGNGSDEILDLCFRIFCRPGTDIAYQLSPTYGMYSVLARINDVLLQDIPLDRNFRFNSNALPDFPADTARLLFVCSPNNPTGNALEDIPVLLERFPGIVVVDEAYVDFSAGPSLLPMLQQYPNLIIVRTLSKARGLAAARIGIAMAAPEIIVLLDKVKPPYNVSTLNQRIAVDMLQQPEVYKARKALIVAERERLKAKLANIPAILEVYPSDANFLLCRVSNAEALYGWLVEKGIIVRNRHKQIPDCIRITVGTPEENEQLLRALKAF